MTLRSSPLASLRALLPAAGLAALLLTAAPADAARRRIPNVVEDALAFATTDRSKAIQLLEDALADGPRPRDLDAITVAAGEQQRLASSSDAAHRWFSKVLERSSRGPHTQAARLGLALLEASGGLDSRILTVLEDVSEKDAFATQNADRFLLLALHAAREGRASDVAQLSRKALSYADEDPAVLERVRSALEALATAPEEAPEPDALLQGKSRVEQAEEALAAGRRDAARRHAEALLAEAEPGTHEHLVATYLLRRIEAPGLSRDTIAVLLPLSGKFGAAGQQMRQALEFGYKAAGGNRRLLVLDSGSTPETAVAALEEAVIDKGAIAVVGPLLSDETDAVVQAAEALRVPLFSLSRSLDETEDLSWTLQAMTTPRDEVEALLDQVMGKDGLSAFAVFAPKSSYGERSTELFKAKVAERGGKVTVVELYDPDSTDLLPFAKALGRKDYDARSWEFRQLRDEARKAGRDPGKVVLPPVLDFDALFIPDNASRVSLACAGLAYEEFPMGDFQPTRESPVIPLLGLSGWNDDLIVNTGGPYVRRGYFTDAFVRPVHVVGDAQPVWTPPAEIMSFIQGYRASVGRTPTPLEAVVSDAGRLLASAARTDASTRADFLKALQSADPAGTVTRVTGISPETNRVERDLWVLTVVKEGILPREAMPPREVER